MENDMGDVGDIDLGRRDRPEPPAAPPSWPIVVAAGLVLILAALMGFWWYSRSSRSAAPQSASAPREQPARPAPAKPLGQQGEAINLPPLGETDPVVRELVRRLSTHPAVLAYLASDGIIRRTTVAVQNVAAGSSPAHALRPLAPQAPFSVRDDRGTMIIDPRSYDRYNSLANAVESLDAQGVARLYGTLKPRVADAWTELGSDSSFDTTLERAIVSLLETPIVEGDVRVTPRGALFAYADPRLEQLSPAQKQLLRTGPRNARIIKAKLREIALALGIPPDRLPNAPRDAASR
jgi:DUF3014 family protein